MLGDIVGPAADGSRDAGRARGVAHVRRAPDGAVAPDRRRASPIGDGIVVLDRVHRFGGAIAELADAVRRATPTRRSPRSPTAPTT